MKQIFAAMALALGAISTGCDLVTLDAPVGEPLTQKEKVTFTGRWINGESEVCDIRIRRDGQLVIGNMEWNDENERYEASEMVIEARKVGDVVVFFLEKQAEAPNFFFARIDWSNKSEFKVYNPDAAKFRAAVEASKLDGKVFRNAEDDIHVRLHAASPSITRDLSTEKASAWFETDGAENYRRVKEFMEVQAEPGVGADSR
jgi:hypothetical protein